MLIDAHTHTESEFFQDETEAIIRRALDAGVWMVNVGTRVDTSKEAIQIAHQYDEGVYAAVGMHPEHAYAHTITESGQEVFKEAEVFDYEAYKEMAQDSKVVAIGECGLDYYFFKDSENIPLIKSQQRSIFEQQIALALEADKVLMIHCRPTKGTMDAYEEVIEMMTTTKAENPELRFQVHCYTGDLACAQKFTLLGGYISLSGIITFDKTGNSEAVVKNIPLEHLLIETDAPFLAPLPYRGKPNEPAYVEYVARKIAEWKELSFGAVADQTTKNARTLFRI
jgi:TatD DNase family protein